MLTLRSLIFNTLFFATIIIMMIIAIPLFAAPRSWALAVAKRWALLSMWYLKTIIGVKIDVQGLTNVPDGACLIAAKHQSMFETVALFALLDDPVFMLKQELLKIPLYGAWIKKFEMVTVDRDGHAKAITRALEATKKALRQNHQVIIFVEGTRTRPASPPRYKRGLTHMAHALNKEGDTVPIIPLALNTGHVWPKSGWRKYPGHIIFHFEPPLELKQTPKQTLAHLQTTLERACDTLPANT